jgi:tryptophan-rich sensory protein
MTAPALRSRRARSPRGPRIVARARAIVASPRTRDAGVLAGFAAIVASAALLGARFSPAPNNPEIDRWYATRRTARLNPPPAAFAPVWTALYAMIAIAGWRVYRAPRTKARTRALALWGAQMAFNAAWSPLFFGARKPRVALADLVAMAGSTAGFIATSRTVDKTASRLMLPYLAWTSFAGYLNASVVRMNPE